MDYKKVIHNIMKSCSFISVTCHAAVRGVSRGEPAAESRHTRGAGTARHRQAPARARRRGGDI